MNLYFKKIKWMNFLSTGNQWTEIQLNRSSSTLIVGENGAGKSTLLDALSFVLYGKPYRNVNKPLLINSITGKNCLVEIEFQAGRRHYKITRGMKPNVFEVFCDGKLVDQNASVREYQEHLEKNILKLNHKSFTQIVVVGSANFVPFMQLKPMERRKVIEDLLDIEIFSKMFIILKEKVSENKDAIVKSKYQLDLLEQNITLTKKHMLEIVSLKKGERDNKQKKVDELKVIIDSVHEEIAELQRKAEELNETISDQSSIKKKLEDVQKYEFQLKHRIQVLTGEIDFLHSNDECPTCSQNIAEQFKDEKITIKSLKKQEIDDSLVKLREYYAEFNARFQEIAQVQLDITELNKEIMQKNTNISVYRSNIRELKKQIESESDDTLTNEDSLKELKKLEKQLGKENKNHSELNEKKVLFDKAITLLKDGGIKARIIKQYVPIINKLMNKYLAAMDFFVQFELDENFNERIKSRFRDEFVYDSFSEGEKMRIDLSLLFTWRAVAKLRNSAATNLLILDEVFDSSLDGNGTDEFLKIITQLSKDTNIFVISHKSDQLIDKFNHIIKFEKVKNFSHIAA